MDDFSISTLYESKNEWSARLVTILTPLITDGYKSIFEEAIKLCKQNNEMDKYLMTFQNFISRVPKWNRNIIETETKRICDKSGCAYLEDLITCVHIIQLKILTAMRVGQKQKKIDINIPKLEDFIHKVYINVARKLYKNVYLFELGIAPLQIQKHNREFEIIIQESILTTLRENIPVEAILKAYMEETVEEDVVEEIREEIVKDDSTNVNTNNSLQKEMTTDVKNNNTNNISSASSSSKLSFNDIDYVKDDNNNVSSVVAPKNIERLEEINNIRSQLNSNLNDDSDDEDNIKLNISNEDIGLDNLDIHVIDEPKQPKDDFDFPELMSDNEFEVLA
jgi:hypothetical protein